MDTTREPPILGPAIPGYRLLRALSRDVYYAEEVGGQRRLVALKVLDVAGADPVQVARFQQEVRIASELRHPHIVETYRTAESAGHLYLAMRYVKGTDLRGLLAESPTGRLDIARTLEIARQVADALDAAHRGHLVHRDVKPANIMIEAGTGQAYLCDFGSAKDLRAPDLTRQVGPHTPLYAAPEQQRSGAVDRRADVYGLAEVIFHCLTGRAPFEASTTVEVYDGHLRRPPPRASTLRPDLPRQVDQVFARALAKRPAHRHPTCSDLVAELEAVVYGRPRPPLPRLPWLVRHAGTTGPWPALRWLAGTPRRRLATVAAAVAVLVAATVLTLEASGGDRHARHPGVPAFPTAAERSLAGLVGDPGCRRAPAGGTGGPAGVLAAVECTPPGTAATSETYYQFDSVANLRKAFDRDAAARKAPNGVDCTQGAAPGFLGNRRYDLRSVDLGGVQCYPGPSSGLVMEWSVEPLRVLGRATGTDPAALAYWWRGYHGPPTPAVVAAVNRQAKPPFPTAREGALLAHIPPASRTDCVRPSDQQVKFNVGNAPVVGVVCGPTSGAAVVFYYQFTDGAAMRASYGATVPNGADCTGEPSGFDGEYPYSRGGETGRLRCSTDNTGDRSLIWTDDRLAIEGMAFQGRDPAAMIDWWRNDAGPS
ncbi:MAG: serine/threonine-protein kinase [Mycobacteriales bacterium]